jgi:NADPH-dependent 2,4-dienoyl-CoA reductase/sulfur reductase-like enzyme
VVVDDCCRVAPGIVAAGDVVARSSPQGVLRRTPHWTNAVEQGRVAAAALLRGGEAVPCRPDLYFWTEMFGLNIKISGELPLDGEPEVVAGSVRYRAALLRWRRGGSSAAVAVNYRIPVSRLKRMASAPEVAPPATALYS